MLTAAMLPFRFGHMKLLYAVLAFVVLTVFLGAIHRSLRFDSPIQLPELFALRPSGSSGGEGRIGINGLAGAEVEDSPARQPALLSGNLRLIPDGPVYPVSVGPNNYQYMKGNPASVLEDLKLSNKMSRGELNAEDPQVIAYLRKYFIILPSTQPYNLTSNTVDTSMGQAAVVNEIYDGMRNGFFIECGALDGETRSNTYFFERYLGWKGILIEADPSNFRLLLDKHRNAYSINACLSVESRPVKVLFKQSFNIGKIISNSSGIEDSAPNSAVRGGSFVEVQCFPLHSILLALNRTTVDYFSLDVEGAELEVLKSIPFDRVNIRVLSVEYIHNKAGELGVQSFMESQGYWAHSKVNNFNNLANDIIFVKKV